VERAYAHEPGRATDLLLESAYELVFELCRATPEHLAGFPRTQDELVDIGLRRKERVAWFRSFFSKEAESGLWSAGEELLPFALPYFGNRGLEDLRRANAALLERRVHAGVHHVDVRRDMLAPTYRPCILLPCHQDVPMTEFEEICRTVQRYAG
jgi:hypothetical protein